MHQLIAQFNLLYKSLSDRVSVVETSTSTSSESLTGYDIILFAGQSNMAGRATISTYEDFVDPDILQFAVYSSDTDTYQKIVQMTEPLLGADSTLAGGRVGPASWFSHSFKIGKPYGRNRRLLILNTAVGGTSIVGGTPTWNATSGTNYTNTITQTNLAIDAAKTIYPNSTFRGIVWIQGETDGDNSVSTSNYQTALTTLIAAFRENITDASDSFFIIGSMVPEAMANNSGYPDIDDAHRAIPLLIDNCIFVPGLLGYSSDNMHYNTQPGERIVGAMLYNALENRYLSSSSISNPTVPTIDGTTSTGETLCVNIGEWKGYFNTFSYQWYADDTEISDATYQFFTLTSSQSGTEVKCKVTAISNSSTLSVTTASVTIDADDDDDDDDSETTIIATYTFNDDTVGEAPANVTNESTGTDTPVVAATTTILTDQSLTSSYTSTLNDKTAGIYKLDLLTPTTSDQTLTWRREETATTGRDGFLLRGVVGTTAYEYGCPTGYLFQTNGSLGNVRIYLFNTSVITLLAETSVDTSSYTYYKATCIGSSQILYGSTDGETYTALVSATDSTISTGLAPIRWMVGFLAVPSAQQVTDITLTCE